MVGGGVGWGGTQRGLFLALYLHPLPVGGGVHNPATGKINCGQAAGLRGSLCGGTGSPGWERPVICEAERK